MKLLTHYFPVALLVAVSILMLTWDVPVNILKDVLSGATVLSYIVYVVVLTSAVVFMPLTVMPVIPLATGVFGPFVTAILSIMGWSLGASIAFLISRHLGRPILERWINLQKLDAIADTIPANTHFWFIVLLRLTLPVDLVSYALGLAKSLSFTSYIGATVLGVTWFSFAFAYLGDAFFNGSTLLLVEIATVSLLVFILAGLLLKRQK